MIYEKNPNILYPALFLCMILVGSIVYIEGIDVITKKTENISCDIDKPTPCKVMTPEGEIINLKQGEEIIRNKFNQRNLNIANYGVWLIIITSLILNHLIYNRNYGIKELKKKYKEIKEKIKIEKI